MTPPTHNLFRDSASRPARRFASATGLSFSCAFALTLFSFAFAHRLQCSQDANAKPASPTQSQAPSSTPAGSSSHASPLKKAVRQKKVITEDDLAQPSKLKSDDVDEGEEDNPVCDYSCQSQMRIYLGFGHERDAEFQNQLMLARHDIAGDKQWLNLLDDARKTGAAYCVIEEQKVQVLGKGEVPQYTRDNVNAQFSDREGKLVQQFRTASALVTQHIQSIRGSANFRSTVMQYQWNGVLAHICPGHLLP